MVEKNAAGRFKIVLMLLLVFGPATLLVLIGTRGCEHKFKVLDDYGSAVDYHFIDGMGNERSSKDFSDHVVLITTLQVDCPENCAVSFWQIDQHVYQPVRSSKDKSGSVRIISFVTDKDGNPVEDVAQVQEMMKDRVEGYDPNVWIVASGDCREIYDFENNNQSLLKKSDEEYGESGYQELILLLDKANHLRMVRSGSTEAWVREMKQHLSLLQKAYDKEKAKK